MRRSNLALLATDCFPLWVKNTFNPSHPGTRISRTPTRTPGTITAVALIRALSMVTVEGRGMLGVPGIAARTFSAVAQTGASVLMISQASSEQSICFVVPTTTAQSVIQSLEKEMTLELTRRDIDRIRAQGDVVIVTWPGDDAAPAAPGFWHAASFCHHLAGRFRGR